MPMWAHLAHSGTATVRVTAKEAAALLGNAKTAKKRTTRREASGPWHMHCVTCGQCFTTQAGQDRHEHNRYEWYDGPCQKGS